jgi:diguanylate cyclase (GGDEF)-like protein
MLPSLSRALATALWTDDPRIRIRLQHWSLTALIYIGGAGVMSQLIDGRLVALWLAFVLAGIGSFHLAMRSGWSDRLADPSMSQPQIVFGTFAVMSGYSVTGEARSCVLFPLIVILAFGSFSVPWRRMAELTMFMLLALACTMLAMHMLQPGRLSVIVDVSNFLICAMVLPVISTIAMLLGRLRNRLEQQRAELRAALARIQDLATRDDLTGLANRRHAQERLELEGQRQARGGPPFAIALIDLDHFKAINDEHGHAGGDAVLCRFAEEASSCAREIDLVVRWGGEEFLLVMPNTTEPAALAAMERLRLHVEVARTDYGGASLAVTCSAGVAEHCTEQSIAQTLLRADRALYRAKAEGRNRTVLAARVHAHEEGRIAAEPAAAGTAPSAGGYSPTIVYADR